MLYFTSLQKNFKAEIIYGIIIRMSVNIIYLIINRELAHFSNVIYTPYSHCI